MEIYDDQTWMKRAFALAANASLSDVQMNPRVGAIYVRDGVVLAQGFHRGFGKLHAEYDALQGQHVDVKGSIVYVTLEPCAHDDLYPACTKLLIQHGVARVVIASLDPNPIEDGDGVAALQHAGIVVVTGVESEQNLTLNYHYFERFK